MKETVLDVLMYLFETYMDEEELPDSDRGTLQVELEEAGFNNPQIEKALEWLDDLAERQEAMDTNPNERTIRLFHPVELEHLDANCRGYLMYLEHCGILSSSQRELVIDRLMALGSDEIDTDEIKWVVLMVLFSQPDQHAAYSQMEDIVFEEGIGALH